MVQTIKRALRHALENLSETNFLTFCQELRDRREEPRVLYSHVEDKSVLQITDLLVSTFTEPIALHVALDLLRLINCNEEAETLNSKTKACVDKGDPTFRKTSTGELETEPSQEARNHVAGQRPFQAAGPGGPPASVKTPEEVEAEAKARVLSEGGDDRNKRLVLSRWTIQFGQYKGQSFKWLLENDVGYTAWWLASHLEQQQDTRGQNSMAVNKDSLERYAVAYPEVLKEVRTLQSAGEALGFGRYKSVTLQKLYESKDEDKISYVNFLRSKSSTCNPGTKMEVAVRYILHRDKNLATNRPTTSFAPRAVRKRQTRKKGVQSTTRQPTRPVRKKPKWS
ncbi:hypothetical protein VZT92_027690 [Zoarces viviparus]|uniref:Pyrin domain-containing protein n=1 Tax=Zoarces viviparus TaxID=48416 RepID=A0AAW1DXN6_ZOAVI